MSEEVRLAPTTYRRRAAQALGRPLRPDEHVHHHSETQLVICTKEYHRWLHRRMKELGIPTPRLAYREKNPMIRISEASYLRLKELAHREQRTLGKQLQVILEEEWGIKLS